ncbi:MAG: hydrogenase iron-sulfur subunit, partial [Candidatus Marinimicrobia bacterium]|nr:hydrogenase iron-sulfur subunit [Candidatus Neomarinimicrobiota bacterium]
LEMANFREHCSWTHRSEPEIATEKAIDLIRSSIEKVRHDYPLEKKKIAMGNRVLVIGGGVAGIQASLDLANAGKEVTLVEKEPTIGGNMAMLTKTFPTEDCAACIISPKMAEVQDHPNIRLLTNTEIVNTTGHRLRFEITAQKKPRFIKDTIDMDQCLGCEKCVEACPVSVPNQWEQGITDRKAIYIPAALAIPYKYLIDEDACLHLQGQSCRKCADVCPQNAIDFSQKSETTQFTVDSVVVATGFDIIDPREKPVFGYGKYKNVVTGLEMERIVDHISENPPPRDVGNRVGFIQCVGSRDEQTGREYCSRVCCMYAIKLASLLKQARPNTDIYIFYTDIRAFGKGYEEYYKKSQSMGIKFIRGKVAELEENPENKKIIVHGEDTLSRQIIEAEFDLMVLSTGIQLSKSSDKIADSLKLAKSSDGFFQEAHPKFRPVDTLVEGVFLAGTAQGPKDIPDTVAQASAAAARVIGTLAQKEFEVDPMLAFVHEDLCDGCGACVSKCPKSAIQMNSENKAYVSEALCVGCGSCIASCPHEALDLHGYTNSQLYAAIQGALAGKTDAQKRIIVFADDSCTYRVADAVGIRKMTYSGDVRIIRIPSASRITDKLIIYTFQQGADGILIGDCPEKSSRFAWSKQQALENIKAAQSYLKTIGIENKRIVFAEFASGMLADFVNRVNQLADVIKTSETVQVNSNR